MIIGLVVCVCIAATVFVWNLLHTLPRNRLSSPNRTCLNCGKRVRATLNSEWRHIAGGSMLCDTRAARHD